MQKNQFKDLPIESPSWLSSFVNIYQTLSTNNLDLLEKIYHHDITFIDPLHHVEGFDDLYLYFKSLYQNLLQCDFIIDNIIANGEEASIYWTMSYRHKKLNKGKVVNVSGTSHIKGKEDKVIYHRDYLDLGAMLYEQIPLFGNVTKWIKAKAAN